MASHDDNSMTDVNANHSHDNLSREAGDHSGCNVAMVNMATHVTAARAGELISGPKNPPGSSVDLEQQSDMQCSLHSLSELKPSVFGAQ